MINEVIKFLQKKRDNDVFVFPKSEASILQNCASELDMKIKMSDVNNDDDFTCRVIRGYKDYSRYKMSNFSNSCIIPVSAINVLKRYGINTIQDCALLSRKDLSYINGIGRLTISRLSAGLARNNLKWGVLNLDQYIAIAESNIDKRIFQKHIDNVKKV